MRADEGGIVLGSKISVFIISVCKIVIKSAIATSDIYPSFRERLALLLYILNAFSKQV